jgi:hypothetical protein
MEFVLELIRKNKYSTLRNWRKAMPRKIIFAFRVNPEERKIIAAIAKKMRRTQGDAIRILIDAAAIDMGISLIPTYQRQKVGGMTNIEDNSLKFGESCP